MTTDHTKTKEITSFRLTGLSLGKKTSNANNQSMVDCGYLWQKFHNEGYFDKIPGKLSGAVFAVYHDYEGDHTQPYSFFIGCKSDADVAGQDGLSTLEIPGGSYQQIIASGQMPDCVANAWREIWATDINRAYRPDFEIYDERSSDWTNAHVEIFVSVK